VVNVFDIRPHRCRTWTLQSYLPDGANVTTSSTPQSASTLYGLLVLPPAEHSEYIDCWTCPGMCWASHFATSKLALHTWGSLPHLIHFHLPTWVQTQTASRFVQLFFYSSLQGVPTLHNGPPLAPQNCPFTWDLNPNLTHGSLSPHEPTTHTASWSVQPFLQDSQL